MIMKKTLISILFILIFLSPNVQSLDFLEEMLKEIKQINQKVDLLTEKADDNQKIVKNMQEEVKQNLTNLDSRIEMTRDDFRIVKNDFMKEIFDRLNSMQKDMKEIKIYELPAVKENFLTLNSNIVEVEQEVIKTKEELQISSDKTFDKVEPMRDEMIRSFESFEYQVKSLNHTFEKKYANITKENPEILKK